MSDHSFAKYVVCDTKGDHEERMAGSHEMDVKGGSTLSCILYYSLSLPALSVNLLTCFSMMLLSGQITNILTWGFEMDSFAKQNT